MQTSTPDGIRTAFSVTGMHCGSCVERVRSAALSAGFSDVQVALSSPQLVIHGNGATDELVRALAEAGYTAEPLSEQRSPPIAPQTSGSYVPLLAVVGLAAALGTAWAVFPPSVARWGVANAAMAFGMALFFLFSGLLKAIDLQAFSAGFRAYDPIAKSWGGYALIYPFLEWGAAAGYFWAPHATAFNLAVASWMGFNTWVAYRTWKRPGTVQCACLGGVLKVPVGPVTTVEFGTMAAMALYMSVL
jgi:copper chaperone CopZ